MKPKPRWKPEQFPEMNKRAGPRWRREGNTADPPDVVRLVVQIHCFLREERVREILENMLPEARQAWHARLKAADEALGLVEDDPTGES